MRRARNSGSNQDAKKRREQTPLAALASSDYEIAHADIVAVLEAARRAVARSVNAVMTAAYWSVGERIVALEQGGRERAAYGDALIERLSADLSARFGRGFSKQNLWQMRAFHLAWPVVDRGRQKRSADPSSALILQTSSGESGSDRISDRIPAGVR